MNSPLRGVTRRVIGNLSAQVGCDRAHVITSPIAGRTDGRAVTPGGRETLGEPTGADYSRDMADEDLEKLSSKELHDRAVRTAVRRGDVKFLWNLLKAIPAAEAEAGRLGESEADIKYVVPMLDDYLHAGDGDLAEVLRPTYLDYLGKHS